MISVTLRVKDLSPGTEGGCEMVITEDMDRGRPGPVSAQFPLSAASKNGEAKYSTSLCALHVSMYEIIATRTASTN